MRREPGILIATLGTKPQVVTTATDLLLSEGHSFSDVLVLHVGGEREPLASALNRLREEFAAYPPYHSLTLQLQPLASASGALPDVETQADAEAAFRAIYRAVLNAKRAGRRVHLSIVGGRKVFAVYGMAAAQLLFDDDDCLWYVLVGGKFFADERLHPGPGDEARLVPVPVLRWSTISPVLTELSQVEDPFEAAERQRALGLRQALDEARAFVLDKLSDAEQPVVKLLVREGLTDEQIAERLSLSPKTVGHHLSSAYAKARARWQLEQVGRHQLAALLKLYFVLESRE